MAARKTKKRSETPDDEIIERILDVDVSSEMESSYLEYAYSVIYSRALPDARDGLKPVQRRILYSMREAGVLPDRSYVKCARVVGQVMGVLHPHGDGAIYDALVRMAQPWVMRVPVVDGHGNFGAPDAPPAAMRYTECRMHSAAMAMTDGMDKETVDFQSNYDGKESEPQVLPAAFPNLLVNGAGGIAVGMATNCAPHNLVEVVQALRHLLKHPDADTDALMKFIPGPDLPTGGKIIGLDGVRDAYRTGKGSFKIRATARIEQVTPRRKGIVITELPFNVGPERVLEQIKSLVGAKKLQGIADLKDLSDLANGTRLVVEIKNGFNPDALLEQLYKQTKLEDSFAINAVALVDEQPRTLSLKDMLEVYLQHRLDVTLRRCTYDRDKAADRLHLVEGLLTAIVDIDDVIAIIRSSEDTASARSRLIEVFELTTAQANFILDMQLRRLTKYSTIELESERDELQTRITELTEIIDNDDQLRTLVGNELAETAKTYGTPRRTILLSSSGVTTAASSEPLEIADDPCWVLLSSTGLLARTEQADPLPAVGNRTNHDVIISAVQTTARGDYGLITSAGRVIRGNALDLPTVPVTANAPTLQGGVHGSELLTTGPGERVLAMSRLTDQAQTIALGTKNGIVKRVNPEVLNKDAWDIIRLEEDDEVVGALELLDPDAHLIFVSGDAQLLRFPASGVRPQGRSGGGVAGVKLGSGQQVTFFGAVPADPAAEDAVLVTVSGSGDALPGTEAGSIKVTSLTEYPAKGRATGGVRCHRFRTGEDGLLFAWAGSTPAIAAADSGAPVDLPDADGRRDGTGEPAPQPIIAAASRTIPAP